MAGAVIWQTSLTLDSVDQTTSQDVVRPLPLRTYSESVASETPSTSDASGHFRRKSTHPHLDLGSSLASVAGGAHTLKLTTVSESRQTPRQPRLGIGQPLSPPMTPPKDAVGSQNDVQGATEEGPDILPYDFSRIDYELDRARAIGQGLWSTVYYAQPVVKTSSQARQDVPSPPLSPQRAVELPSVSLYAIKIASRADARHVFLQEARTLTKIQQHSHADDHVVRFMGLDERVGWLVFEGVVGGSLDSLPRRLKVMTELERHLELRNVFPKIAADLISGMEFIHSADVVHADIKPANILFDVAEHDQRSLIIIRARYIDFSAAFTPGQDSSANAGGTWDYMAPEQLRIQKDLNTPTFASDIWSLGITLLSTIVGGSPYTAACGENLFILREAIKSGDPLGFARMDPVVQKRMAACQDFVDCCKMALQKDRARRATATVWRKWLMENMN